MARWEVGGGTHGGSGFFLNLLNKFNFDSYTSVGPRGGAVGWGTALQAGRSRVRSPMVSLEFRLQYDNGFDSACNRNEYQEYLLGVKGGRCIRLATLPLSCADCLEICMSQLPGPFWTCNMPVQRLFYLFISSKMLSKKGLSETLLSLT